MRKLLLTLAVLCGTVSAWAQVYQKVPHTKWTVTAPNQYSSVSGNEGGVAFIQDENPLTFYHSDWSGTKPGQNGLQGFLIDMAEEISGISQITYKGRSDNNKSGWARGVKIYLYNTLPEGLPANLSTVAHENKDALLTNAEILGTPAFDNTEESKWWADDLTLKTVDFTETKTARYVLFVMHKGHDNWLTCSDFNVWQKVDDIVEDKPYFLKIKGLDNYYLDTRVGASSNYGNTICKTQTPVATYFTLNDGYWHISSLPGNERNFIGITNWDAIPGKDTPTNWTLHEVEEGLWSLAQSTYYGGGDAQKHYLGANDGNISGNSKVYTDKPIGQAVKFELVELTEEEAAAEATRVTEENLRYAKETATAWLNRVGAGYPAVGNEARTALQNAINAEDATRESVEAALAEYQAYQTVVMPEVGKVYRLVSGYTAFSSKKALYSDNNELKWQNKNDAAMNQLWTVLSCANGNIVLMNVNDALYPQKTNFATNVTMFSSKNECSISFCGKAQFQVFANKLQRMFADGHASGNGASGNITNYNDGGVDSYSSWYFEEVAITKDILSKQIESLSTAYIGSLLVKQESVADLAEAVDAAQGVCDAEGDYANAFATLVASVNNATIDYIDLGYFYMKSKVGNKYAYNDGNNLKAAEAKTCKSIFKLTKANNGTFYVQNGNGYYAQNVAQSAQTVIGSSAVEYVISRLSTNHYVLRPKNSTDTHQFWHQDGSNKIVGWETAGGNTQWTFEALSEEELAKIYNVNISSASATVTYGVETYAGDKTVQQNGGFYVLDSAPAVEDFTVNGLTEGLDSRVFVSGRDITVLEGYDSKNIYIIRSKNGSSYARYHSGSKMSAEDETNMLTYENNNLHWESLFYIEEGTGDYTGYYTIRPVSAPSLYVYNLESVDRSSAVATKESPTESDLTANYYWKISTFGTEYANITPYGADDCGWNKRGSYDGKNHIGYWKGYNNADDNKWIVRKVEEELVDKFMPYTTDNSVLGYVTYESAASMLPYIEMINPENLNKVKSAKFDVVLPKQGKFYRIQNENATGYLSSGTGTGRTQFVAGIGEKASSIFYFTGNKLVSYTTGLYLAVSSNFVHYTDAVGENAGTTFTFAQSPVWGKLLISFNNGNRSFYSNAAGNSNAASKGQTGEFYRFTVEEVKWLPVAMNKEVGYATLYSPVELGLNGRVKAYTGKIDGDVFELNEQTAVPANTGVVLELLPGAEVVDNYVYLPVQNATVTVSEDENDLKGTFADTYISESSYVLSNKAGIGFYKAEKNQEGNTSWLNNGFRAYLPAGGAAARFLVFDFGTETGIDQLEGENGNVKTEVYDLSGRRVQSAQKGIFIVNGKKVIR